ncbi:MAG: amidohydrolase family protein [Acidobacteria bacterium]|nr:amidohydrolase family protein [Acidobacteriota bacterium]
MRYRAAWVLPVAQPPIRDGWVEVQDGRITAVGGGEPSPVSGEDLGQVALMPGLVNAHTHLELSYLRGQVPQATAFVDWIRHVVGARRQRPDPGSPEIMDGLRAGIGEAVRSGTALVGDISNTLVTFDALADSPLGGVVFYELLRFNAPDPQGIVAEACERLRALGTRGDVTASLAAHAPYSVAPALFASIRHAMDERPGVPYSVHLSESRDEVEFIATGHGEWRRFLEDVGAWDPAFTPPAVSPVAYLGAAGFLDSRLLAVHGVQMTRDDLARLAARETTLVTCPRSNVYTGAGTPPVSAFFESGVRVAVGTDSLASTPDLNLFSELAALRAIAPGVPARRIIESGTINGAMALGLDASFGTLEAGKRARVLAVSIPPGTTDVEEYLVSGVAPEQVFWVGDAQSSPSRA